MTRLSAAVALACGVSVAFADLARHSARTRSLRSSRSRTDLHVRSTTWTLQDDHTPEKILANWTFETQDWDSSSAAQYVDQTTAYAAGMARLQDGGVYLGVDTTATISGPATPCASPGGRTMLVRLYSRMCSMHQLCVGRGPRSG